MNTQEQEVFKDPSQKKNKKRKKKRAGIIILILILVAAAACGAAYYILERQKPAKAVENFLTRVQEMDFNGMSALLQSSDLTLLDEADIRDETYAAFFQNVNSKMTFDISRNQFNIYEGTAKVTAHINYIDGTDIYKETITEFLRKIVSTAFSGEDLTEQEVRETLSSLLQEKSQTVEDRFSETEIEYSVIKTSEGWKIVALDEETVKIMSANFKSVEDEINQSLADLDGSSSDEPQSVASPSEEEKFDIETDRFSIHYIKHTVGKDFGGEPCLMLYYEYTNNSSSASSAMVDVNIRAYQNGESLEAAIPETNEEAIDNYMSDIQTGQTVTVCQAFSLKDKSDVTIEASEAFVFSGGEPKSQILKLKE